MSLNLPPWALEIARVSNADALQPPEIDRINLPLNRVRLARFLTEFADDQDVADLLTFDVLCATAGLPINSTGLAEVLPSLVLRPFRLWEYFWLYRTLNLSAGGVRVLDLGGPATHLTLLAALAGCRVTTLDINAQFVTAAQECARELQMASLDARVGDMRDLSAFPNETFDVVVSCSVLEHLTGDDQETALREMARVLRPGGLIGLTFDFGPSAAGANVYLPPPHDPPPDAAEALRRFTQGGLVPVGNRFAEDPVPGCLFIHDTVRYTVASLFLAKPPVPTIGIPQPKQASGSVLNALRIPCPPFRFYRTVFGLENSLQQGRANGVAAEERLTELELKEAALQQAIVRANSLEAAIAERLTAIQTTATAALNELLGKFRRTKPELKE
jgi:2-polyprenyl-3-methyl-5-hydroxy-6-metoxy-1,4-benzoquinol methylase